MPRGGRRAGAGRPRQAVATHVLRGTYKASKYGPLPGNVLPMPALHETWRPDAGDLAALADAGRAFVARMTEAYTFSPSKGVTLTEAAHMSDRLAALRAAGTPSVRDEVALVRVLASLIAQLRVEA